MAQAFFYLLYTAFYGNLGTYISESYGTFLRNFIPDFEHGKTTLEQSASSSDN